MRQQFHQPIAQIGTAIIGFAIGYFVSDDSAELAKLRAEVAERVPATAGIK